MERYLPFNDLENTQQFKVSAVLNSNSVALSIAVTVICRHLAWYSKWAHFVK